MTGSGRGSSTIGHRSGPRTRTVTVDGGDLAIAEWGPDSGPVVLAVHGITASSRAWTALARLLPEVRLVAPDLRGRGRSSALPGPYGLRRHVADLQRVLDDSGADRAVVVGHSMGGFAAALLAAAEPRRVARVVLVDGGLPLAPPQGVSVEDLLGRSPAALLGPAFERLTRVFPSRDDYRAFWRGHPAFADDWTADVADYADYDLVEVPGGFRPSADPEAVAADQRELFGPDWYREALRSVAQPVTVLRAPFGLLAEPPGLYAPGALEASANDLPQLEVVEVHDVNHCTLLMTSPGAGAVASAVRASVTGP